MASSEQSGDLQLTRWDAGRGGGVYPAPALHETVYPPVVRHYVKFSTRVLAEGQDLPDAAEGPTGLVLHLLIRVAEAADPAPAVVAVEIVPHDFGNRFAAVDKPASHGASLRVTVLQHREREPLGAAARRVEAVHAFHHTPAVIESGLIRGGHIDFLPGIRAHVDDVEQSRHAIERVAPGIPKPVRPDLSARTRCADERVVGRDGVRVP